MDLTVEQYIEKLKKIMFKPLEYRTSGTQAILIFFDIINSYTMSEDGQKTESKSVRIGLLNIKRTIKQGTPVIVTMEMDIRDTSFFDQADVINEQQDDFEDTIRDILQITMEDLKQTLGQANILNAALAVVKNILVPSEKNEENRENREDEEDLLLSFKSIVGSEVVDLPEEVIIEITNKICEVIQRNKNIDTNDPSQVHETEKQVLDCIMNELPDDISLDNVSLDAEYVVQLIHKIRNMDNELTNDNLNTNGDLD